MNTMAPISRETSHTPRRDLPEPLLRADVLIRQLQTCLIFSTTSRASSISLIDGNDPNGSVNLATTLAENCHMGLDKLVTAHKAFLTIHTQTRAILQETGPLNALQSTFGVRNEKRSFDRHLKRLTSATELCKTNCDELAQELEIWKASVHELSSRISDTLGALNQEEGEITRKIDRLQTEMSDQKLNEERAQANEDAARLQRDTMSQKRSNIERQIGAIAKSAKFAPTLYGSLLFQGGMFAASWVAHFWTGNDLQAAQHDMQQQLERGQEYRRMMGEAELEIQKLSTQTRELSEYIRALEPVLRLLYVVIECLRNAALHQNGMLTSMNELVERRLYSGSIAAECFEDPSYQDRLDFFNAVQEMRVESLKIGHWSLVYSRVISETMIRGFQQMHPVGKTNGEDSDMFFEALQSRQQFDSAHSGSARQIQSTLEVQHEKDMDVMKQRHDKVIKLLTHENKKDLKRAARGSTMRKLLPFSRASESSSSLGSGSTR